MCLLLVLRGRFASHPVLVAGNRDERTDRKSSPPGLWVGQHERALSPRDREKGGTWMCVSKRGMFAGLTNWSRTPVPDGAATRGDLPHLAVDAGSIAGAEAAVATAMAQRAFGGFQLVLADRERIVVLRHRGAGLERMDWTDELLVVTNEHGPAELQLPGMAAACEPRATPEEQLEALRPLLLDDGAGVRHPVLKRGASYGTVSSSLVAVPSLDPLQLQWRYAAGRPDETAYMNYGNLGRRLLD